MTLQIIWLHQVKNADGDFSNQHDSEYSDVYMGLLIMSEKFFFYILSLLDCLPYPD